MAKQAQRQFFLVKIQTGHLTGTLRAEFQSVAEQAVLGFYTAGVGNLRDRG